MNFLYILKHITNQTQNDATLFATAAAKPNREPNREPDRMASRPTPPYLHEGELHVHFARL